MCSLTLRKNHHPSQLATKQYAQNTPVLAMLPYSAWLVTQTGNGHLRSGTSMLGQAGGPSTVTKTDASRVPVTSDGPDMGQSRTVTSAKLCYARRDAALFFSDVASPRRERINIRAQVQVANQQVATLCKVQLRGERRLLRHLKTGPPHFHGML